jgi:hypothetical protein
MAYGLKILDGAGRLLLDVVDRNPRLWSTHTISGGTQPGQVSSGFVSVPGMARDGTWFVTASAVTPFAGGYFIGGTVNCYAVSGGFNWDSGSTDSSGYTAVINVYKL